jgi:hypothetical protein
MLRPAWRRTEAFPSAPHAAEHGAPQRRRAGPDHRHRLVLQHRLVDVDSVRNLSRGDAARAGQAAPSRTHRDHQQRRVGDTVTGSIARFGRDVLAQRPDLVIWQLGTNDVAPKAQRDGHRRRPRTEGRRRRRRVGGPAIRPNRAFRFPPRGHAGHHRRRGAAGTGRAVFTLRPDATARSRPDCPPEPWNFPSARKIRRPSICC